MDNLNFYEKVREVPASAQKKINGGRMNGKTDINPMWRIKTLTELFGPCGIGWYYITTKKWTEPHGIEMAAFVDIELYIKVDNEWSKPISGTGGSMFVANEKNGPYVSDECYKMATTDAISVACKQLGIGADVYWEADKTKYDKNQEQDFGEKVISSLEAKTLKALCQRKGLDISTTFTVPVEQLTIRQYVEAVTKLENMKDKAS
jgi:hypothetical protein